MHNLDGIRARFLRNPCTKCAVYMHSVGGIFDDCYAELTDINKREIFVYAFRLGMRIAIEVLTEE